MPLYQEIQMRYNEKKQAEERERSRKLREHKQQYQVVSFKNEQARKYDNNNYEEKLRIRGRLARGGIEQQYHKYTQGL